MAQSLDRAKIRERLKAFDLQPLFIEDLGWDHGGEDLDIPVEGRTFALKAVAQKRGMVAYQYIASSGEGFPDYPTRQKITKRVAKATHEHMIIYAASDKAAQYWQWIKHESDRPDRIRQHVYYRDQSGESLIQKLERLVFTLEEEENLSIVDVSRQARAAFDVEKVTKKFYTRFQKEHVDFLDFIKGIQAATDREWYASLMLNRMMFIYFIQKRGFLDGDQDYLRNRLERMQKAQGKDRFQNFYRLFLLRLFHEGLSQPEAERTPELADMLGKVPYLNGGLFEVHDLERDNTEISIPDEAFQKIFDFFDDYDWHLDNSSSGNDREINPDVLGYIFEKYINQKEMGAYYTKEDITGYISRNTVIPYLFDEAKKECSIAFKPGGGIWRLLSDDPDRYFYKTASYGVSQDIPADIAAGIDDISKRGGWNKAAPDSHALPTETWREYIARRQRYEEIRSKLTDGAVASINDMVTYNLDIEKFTQDVIANSEGPELVRAFWKALNKISVLDPTCGSGAFLFAALNILEPVYVTCLEAMSNLLDDLQRSKRERPNAMKDFSIALDRVKEHASERYFIFKSIVINNLYGVDIMEEAVEICKLRLFLKLVAQLKTYDQIEPLPDIDFNIRAGNTLVGFTSLAQIKKALKADLLKQKALPKIEEHAERTERAFKQFRDMQIERGMDAAAFTTAKTELRNQLEELRTELDSYLAGEYSVKTDKEKDYLKWRSNHLPFHWFVEFYGIMKNGGFSVILGNPPYVQAAKVRKVYDVRHFVCGDCPDVYAWVLERSQTLLRTNGRSGMIVPLSLGFSSNFASCRNFLFSGYGENWFSSFGRIPSALFSFDVRVRHTIHIGCKSRNHEGAAYTTRLHRWFGIQREALFHTLEYTSFEPALWGHKIPKLNNANLAKAFEGLFRAQANTLEITVSKRATPHALHFKKSAYNWLNYCREVPPCYDGGGNPIEHTKFGKLYFQDTDSCQLSMLLANGKLMLAFWFAIGDDFDVTRGNFTNFPTDFTRFPKSHASKLLKLAEPLEAAMAEAVQFKMNAGKRVGNYNLGKCREITDLSDKIFCDALGLSGAWEDIELYYVQTVRTDIGQDEDA